MSQYAKFMLALTVWREMSNFPRGWRMCIWTILNRVAKGGWWGHDVVGVVTCPYQFSSMTAPGDANLRRWPADGDVTFEAIMAEVENLTDGTIPVSTDAVYYFSAPLTSPPPAWGAVELVEGGDLGKVKFYRQALPLSSRTVSTPASTNLALVHN